MARECRISYDRNLKLGKGGYGFIYGGVLIDDVNENIETPVAVKRILIDDDDDDEEEELASDRELIQLKLNHPNVVKLLHWEDVKAFRLYALELCDVSLDKVYEDPENYRGLLPSQLDFMLQLSHGLEYIHNQNLVHRDIKPGNVLICYGTRTATGESLAKWADFGFSKTTDAWGKFEMSGQRGTDCYWAPEIHSFWEKLDRFKKNDVDYDNEMTIMSDVFASGCVFFEFCTDGKHPFGDGVIRIKVNLLQSSPVNMNGLTLKESHFSFKIIKKMLESKPQERPNLREIIQQLSSLKKMVMISKDLNKRKSDQFKEYCSTFELNEIDQTQEKLKKMKEELHTLCSLGFHSLEQIEKIAQIVAEDEVGLVNMVDDDGFSPLQILCRNNQKGNIFRCTTALLATPRRNLSGEEFKVDVNYVDRDGFNALHYLCMHYQGSDFLEMLKLLIDHGIDVNKTDQELQRNALQMYFGALRMYFRLQKHNDVIDIVKTLLESGIDAKHVDREGRNVLHHLSQGYTHKKLIEVVQLLIDNGVDATAKDKKGWTVLSVMCKYYNHNNMIEVAKLLIDKGVDVTAKESNGWTALHLLCRYHTCKNLIHLIPLLLDEGVDVNEKTPNGWTALHFLCQYYILHDNLIDLIRLLIEKGIDVKTKTPNGWTALHILCGHYTHDNLIEIVRLLIDKGVEVAAVDSTGRAAIRFLYGRYTRDVYKKTNRIDLVRLLLI